MPVKYFRRLGSLNGAQHASDSTQHTSLRACGNGTWRRRFLEHAVIACCARQMGERLAIETQDATMRERLSCHHASIIDEKLHGEVVGAIHDEVIFLDDVERIRRVEEFVVGVHFHVRVDGLDFLLCALYLWHAHILGEMDDLTLEVGEVHHIGINDADASDACSSEIERDGRTQSAGPHNEYAGIHNLFLALHADIRQQDMSGIALYLFF